MAKKAHLVDLLKLRISIGLLGETQANAWWSSSFFSSTSSAFLAPMFSRTTFLARNHGVREAAARVHDEHIGVGANVFHLFRLPERFERDLHELLHDDDASHEVAEGIYDQETAEEYVQGFSKNIAVNNIGPVRIGTISDIERLAAWQRAAQHYLNAFQTGSKVFPFFSEER